MEGTETLIDATVILRYLVGDGDDFALKARDIFKKAVNGEINLIIPEIALTEAINILIESYNQNRSAIATALRYLIRLPGVQIQTPISVFIRSLGIFEKIDTPWTDALFTAYAYENNFKIKSFDNRYNKLLNQIN